MLELRMSLANFIVASPTLRPTAFDHDDFIFELKMGGFRALAFTRPEGTRLVALKCTRVTGTDAAPKVAATN